MVAGATDDNIDINVGGAAYVLEHDAGQWSVTHRLAASDVAAGDRLGFDVDYDGTTIVASAPGANPLGAVYVFVRDGTGWTEQAKLTPSQGQSFPDYGRQLSLSGDTVAVAAPLVDQVFVHVRNGNSSRSSAPRNRPSISICAAWEVFISSE